jgi:hypothetical protein
LLYDGIDTGGGIPDVCKTFLTSSVSTEYFSLAKTIAGSLYPIVQEVFPQHYALLYITCSERRRQIWNAVLSTIHHEIDKDQIKNLRNDLLTKKGSALIEQVYGSNPPGFISLIGRFGRIAQSKETYDKLFELVRDDEKLARALTHDLDLSASLIDNLHLMPKEYRSLPFVKALDSSEKVLQFVSLLRHFEDNPTYEATLKDLRRLIWAAEPKGIATFLHNVYRSLSFPEPVVPDSLKTRYLHNGLSLDHAAQDFKNCLKDSVPSAVRGEAQFYVWRGAVPAVVSIVRHRNRWVIEDIRGRKNRKLMKDEHDKICAHFAEHGVTKELDFSELLERFILPSAWQDNPFAIHTDERFEMEYQFLESHWHRAARRP